MNHRSIFTLLAITMLALALLPSDIFAQQGSLKQQLVGTWTLVSYDAIAADGITRRQLSGSNVKGILIFGDGGGYASVLERVGRPKFKSAAQPTTEELAAATADFFAANFGTWSVSEADKVLTQRFEGALRPNNDGADARSSVSLAGDELKLTTINPLPTGAKIEQAYRRAK